MGIDTDWNAWISLADEPSDLTMRINVDGNNVLPCGINMIREHIKTIDTIPLQVPMFCDVTEKNTEEMFKIYQENGDVVACIGNILNTENMHIY